MFTPTDTSLDSVTINVIPEPATFGFIGIFEVGALAVRRIFMMESERTVNAKCWKNPP